MGKIVRCISKDGSVFALAIDSTDMVNQAADIHKTSAVVTAAMGRLMTAASIMGYVLKGEGDSVTLRTKSDGPLDLMIAVSDSSGNVRAYVSEPVVEIPLNDKGKLDVGGALGGNGILYVMKDLGLKEPYIGSVPFISGEIAEEITSYYALSEQVPTVCALGVLVNPDLSVKAAGGYLIQILPFADDETIAAVEESLKDIPPVTNMLSEELTPFDICKKALSRFEIDILDEREPEYKCNCSKKKVEKALISIGETDLKNLAKEQESTEVKCHFCNKAYHFSSEDLYNLLKRAKQ